MPLYEYECRKCRRRTEKIESVSGPHLKKCPHCGGKVERLLAPPAIQFKGAGWYVTDYAGKKSDAGEGNVKEKNASTEGSAKETGTKESTKESSAKETKEKKAGRK